MTTSKPADIPYTYIAQWLLWLWNIALACLARLPFNLPLGHCMCMYTCVHTCQLHCSLHFSTDICWLSLLQVLYQKSKSLLNGDGHADSCGYHYSLPVLRGCSDYEHSNWTGLCTLLWQWTSPTTLHYTWKTTWAFGKGTLAHCSCTYICYAQNSDSDHPRISSRKARISAMRNTCEDFVVQSSD